MYSDYTTSELRSNKIDVLTRTMVQKVEDKRIVALDADKKPIEIPYGLLVSVFIYLVYIA